MADEKDPNEATTHADLYHREGVPDPSEWEEAEAVTGRPADAPSGNSTFAERAKTRGEVKRVDSKDAENKAVQAAQKKAAPAKRTRKSSK